jgi:hypothetical protein
MKGGWWAQSCTKPPKAWKSEIFGAREGFGRADVGGV